MLVHPLLRPHLDLHELALDAPVTLGQSARSSSSALLELVDLQRGYAKAFAPVAGPEAGAAIVDDVCERHEAWPANVFDAVREYEDE